ncbi:hypothetical protein ACIPX0_40155 [Streptomyces sp. NPDC090075]|uniref:hypothetical protein n=1 Tax=Streptomyces sp. NPDC090075 TaxID=3365937 RepID=UPI0037F2B36A
MPHTAAMNRSPRTARPAPGTPAPARPARGATAVQVMPLWEAMALLFAPAKTVERP